METISKHCYVFLSREFQTVYCSGSQTVVREGLKGGTRTDLQYFVFLHKKYIHSYNFYLWGSVNKFLNFCVVYFPCWFLKMAIILSHSHFLEVAFASILVFQTFDRIIIDTLSFPGTRWYVLTVRDPQMVGDQKVWEPLVYCNWVQRKSPLILKVVVAITYVATILTSKMKM